MDIQRGLPINWPYFYQEKSMDDLRQSLLLTMELEDTKLKAQEEVKIRDQEISQLKEMLDMAVKERDEAQEKCRNLFFEKQILLIQQQQIDNIPHSSVEDEPIRGISSSSDCDESIVSSPAIMEDFPMVMDRPLPEKGKLLEAVMKAGPLLQTLLLAGPLPRWRHPPPPLESYQIPPPPVLIPSISGNDAVSRKRVLPEGSDSPAGELKYQRGLLFSN